MLYFIITLLRGGADLHIGELSKKTGISVRSLRHYENKNLLQSKRMVNGYRLFDDSAVERVKIIQLYLSFGLTTDEISKILECPVTLEDQQPLCDKVIELYELKLKEVNEQIILLENIRANLEKRINAFQKHNL